MVHFEGQGLLVPIATTASAYAAGRQVGGLNKLSAVVPDSRGCLDLFSLATADGAKQSKGFNLLFFDKAVTVPGDNVAFDVSAADAAHFLGLVTVLDADYMAAASRSFAAKSNIRMLLQSAKAVSNNIASVDLWCVVVTTSSPTYTANCLNLVLGLNKQR